MLLSAGIGIVGEKFVTPQTLVSRLLNVFVIEELELSIDGAAKRARLGDAHIHWRLHGCFRPPHFGQLLLHYTNGVNTIFNKTRISLLGLKDSRLKFKTSGKFLIDQEEFYIKFTESLQLMALLRFSLLNLRERENESERLT